MTTRLVTKRSGVDARHLLGLLLALGLLVTACVSNGSAGDDGANQDEDGGQAGADDGTDGVVGTDSGDGDGDDPGELPVGAVADPARLASLEPTPCSFDEPIPLPVNPTCYAVSVPEDWADPDDQDQVMLQVAVFDGDGGDEDPIIYFDGGPGGHTLDALSFSFEGLIQPYLGTRDYIVFDQRGLGESEPSLSCPELIEVALADLQGEIEPALIGDTSSEAQQTCRERLEASGVDLAAYNSIASANDVEAIRSLLEYEQLNVIGISYGTRLAQTYMRLYPASIRSVVLDSVFPTGYDLWTNFSPGAQRAFEQFFAGCAASPSCSGAYPNLESDFFALLDELDEEPIEVEVQNLTDGETMQAMLDGHDVMGLVFSALYDRQQFAAVPQMVEEARAGNYTTVGLFGSIQLTNIDFVSLGMRLSVECNEEITFESEDEYLANEPSDAGYARLQRLDGGLSIFDSCQSWPAGQAPEVEGLRIDSELPTLLLAGQYDPITPPAGVDEVAAGLTTAYSFLLPNEGHGIVPTECGAELVNAFIADPMTEPDGSCVATAPEPAWAPGEIGDIELIDFEVEGLVSIKGLRPAGWTDAGNGVFVRQDTAVDPTTLVIQPTNGLPADNLVQLVSQQLQTELVAGEDLVIGDQTWTSYATSPLSTQAARAAISPGPDGVLVLLGARSDEIDALYDAVFLAVAEAAEPG